MDHSITEIMEKTQALADQRARMNSVVTGLNQAVKDLMADRLPEVRAAIDAAAQTWAELETMLRESPQLFVKPRTVTVAGIKVGYEKGKGGLEIPNPARTVELIKKHLADQVELLIDTKETPAKGALQQLPAADLRRVGVNVKDTGDRIVIRPADTELDKMVKALVGDAVDEATEPD